MAQTSFAVMTTLGRAKEAAALANATTITVTQIAIGDGATVPSGGETALYHEVARKAITGHGTVAGAANVAYFDCYLAAGDGPYTIREAGLYDNVGDLIAIAHYDPPINKPVPASGQTVEGTVRLEVAFSDVANVTIVVDPSLQVALQRLTRLPWIPIISMTLTAPPVAPVAGDTYLVAGPATGAWTAQEGKIAEYTTAGWAIITPPDGHGISLPDGRVFERVAGAYVQKIALDTQSGKWLYGVAGGTGNAITVALDPVPPALVAGMHISVKITAANTGAVTLNANGLGAKALNRSDGAALQKGELVVGQVIEAVYDGAAFQVVNFAGGERTIRRSYFATWAQSLVTGVQTQITSFTMVENNLGATTFSGGVLTVNAADAGLWEVIFSAVSPSAGAELVAIISNSATGAGAISYNTSQTAQGAPGVTAPIIVRLGAGQQISFAVRQVSGVTLAMTGLVNIMRVGG
jgi:hypothetical protein